jgi:hypothetical protein
MSDPDVSNMVESLVPQAFDTTELMPSAGAAEKQFEIQSAIVVARRFPRNESQAFERLMRACQRSSFADDASYSFPRGSATVTGPSVGLAREAARVWGNIRYGLEIVRDDETSRQIRGWAWDLETNTKVSAEDDFSKLIQRKGKNGQPTQWVKPDERDLRELTNRRGAICVRNSILQLLPKDLIEDAEQKCKETLRSQAQKDPEAARKKLILAFSELNVTPVMLEAKLGHPLAEASPAEIAELRTIYKSIADGNSTWAEYVRPQEPPQPPAAGLADLTEKLTQETVPAGYPQTPPTPTPTETAAAWEQPTGPRAVPPPTVIDQTPLTTAAAQAVPMSIDEIKTRVTAAQFVSDVRALRTLWCGPKSERGDTEKAEITKICEARIVEIKTSGTNTPQKG